MKNAPSTFSWPNLLGTRYQLSRDFKLAFISACVIGFITHLYAFTNILLSEDASRNAFSNNAHLSLGRWSLEFFSSFSSFFQMPVVIGLISILMLALTAGLTVRVLALTHPVSIVLTSALLVTFPAVGATFTYMYTADAYFIALFINCAAAYLAKKYSFGWIASVALIATACGIYQSYICYAAGLLLIDCIMALLSREKVKTVLSRGGTYILALVLGLLLYCVIQMLLLKVNNMDLTTYQGADTIGQISLSSRLAAIPAAYKMFISSFFRWPHISPVLRMFQWLSLLVSGISLLYLVIADKLWREPARLLLIVAGCLLLPLALNLIKVLAYTAYIHRLMIYAYVLWFVFAVKCAEAAAQRLLPSHGQHIWKIPIVAALLCCAAVSWNNFCLTNIGYHSFQICYENTFALANRVAVRLEMLEGYSAGDTPVAFVGMPSSDIAGNSKNYQGYLNGEIMGNPNLVLSKSFFQLYTGVTVIKHVSAEQAAELTDNEAVATMPVYPAQGSVSMVDGIAVVKFAEEGGIK